MAERCFDVAEASGSIPLAPTKGTKDKKIKMIIIDGELMPWSAIGKTLIEDEFLAVDCGLKTEIDYMKKYNFDDILIKQKEKLLKDQRFVMEMIDKMQDNLVNNNILNVDSKTLIEKSKK